MSLCFIFNLNFKRKNILLNFVITIKAHIKEIYEYYIFFNIYRNNIISLRQKNNISDIFSV